MCHKKKRKKSSQKFCRVSYQILQKWGASKSAESTKISPKSFFFFADFSCKLQHKSRSSVRVVFYALEEARKLCKRTRPLASATRSCAERIQRRIIRPPYDFHNSAILRRVRRTRRCLNDRPREHCSNVLRVPFYLCDRTTVGAHRNGVRHDSSQTTREG